MWIQAMQKVLRVHQMILNVWIDWDYLNNCVLYEGSFKDFKVALINFAALWNMLCWRSSASSHVLANVCENQIVDLSENFTFDFGIAVLIEIVSIESIFADICDHFPINESKM